MGEIKSGYRLTSKIYELSTTPQNFSIFCIWNLRMQIGGKLTSVITTPTAAAFFKFSPHAQPFRSHKHFCSNWPTKVYPPSQVWLQIDFRN
jgi:hypothetical protein